MIAIRIQFFSDLYAELRASWYSVRDLRLFGDTKMKGDIQITMQ